VQRRVSVLHNQYTSHPVTRTSKMSYLNLTMMLTAARIHQFSHLYVLPVLRMTSRFHIIEKMGENRIRPVFFFQFATVAAQGEKSAVSDYILFLSASCEDNDKNDQHQMHKMGAMFDTNVGHGSWPLLTFSFAFCCVATPFYGKLEDGPRCPSVDVDAFATSTACCDLDL